MRTVEGLRSLYNNFRIFLDQNTIVMEDIRSKYDYKRKFKF
jgi:hypothetical protein